MKKDAFTSKQACYLSACTSHQLRYWDKVNLVNPSIQSSNGKPGVPKMYSFRDIVALISFPQWTSYWSITPIKMSHWPAGLISTIFLLSHYAANCRS